MEPLRVVADLRSQGIEHRLHHGLTLDVYYTYAKSLSYYGSDTGITADSSVIGYVRKLPPEYTGERHIVTVGRAADGKYRWEERRGAPPASEDSPKSISRIFLVRAKDGRPDFSWPEDANP